MPRWNGFLASVRVNGKALEEYAVDTKDDSATSWIASEEGQVFDVALEVEEPGVLYSAHLEVDGVRISRRTHNSDACRCSHKWRGKRISDTQVRPFQFTRVDETDDESRLLRTPANLTRSIVIRICRVGKRARSYERTEVREFGEHVDTNVKVFEKTKVLNPHAVSFSHEAIQAIRGSSSSTSYKRLDSRSRPFFTFNIFYGPKDFLRAQGIIPRETEQGLIDSPPEAKDVSVLLRDLERRMAEADRERAEMQREMKRIWGASRAGIKSEATPEISFAPGEVIDLTED